MKPLTRATADWRLHGVAQLGLGVALAGAAAAIHTPFALAEAPVAGAIFGLFLWVLLYRGVLGTALGRGAAPPDAVREEPGAAVRRVVRITAVTAAVMLALTVVAGGTAAGIVLGNGGALLLLATSLRAREREAGLIVLREPAWRPGRTVADDLYVDSE